MKKKLVRLIGKVSVIFIVIFCSSIGAKDYTVNGKAEFLADANPGFLKIIGKGGNVIGVAIETDGVVNGEFKVKVDDFTTGLSLRDDHMKNKYMESSKYPDVIVRIKNYKIGDDIFSGDLTMRDITKPINGSAKAEGNKVKAEFFFKITDYGVTRPNWKGVGVDEKIKAIVEIEYKQ
jgi:hypothetical protein